MVYEAEQRPDDENHFREQYSTSVSRSDAFLCIQYPDESHGSRTAELVHGDF